MLLWQNICKGPRGLKMHQRTCQVVHGLNAELYADIEEQINHDTENIAEMDQSGGDETFTVNNHDIPTLKRVLNSPKVIYNGQRPMIISNLLFK